MLPFSISSLSECLESTLRDECPERWGGTPAWAPGSGSPVKGHRKGSESANLTMSRAELQGSWRGIIECCCLLGPCMQKERGATETRPPKGIQKPNKLTTSEQIEEKGFVNAGNCLDVVQKRETWLRKMTSSRHHLHGDGCGLEQKSVECVYLA